MVEEDVLGAESTHVHVYMFLEIAARPKISRNLNTLAGSEPENNIAAERRRLPAGACFVISWLSHLNVDKQAGHI